MKHQLLKVFMYRYMYTGTDTGNPLACHLQIQNAMHLGQRAKIHVLEAAQQHINLDLENVTLLLDLQYA